MASSNTIKEFLVALGVDISSSGVKRFFDTIGSMTQAAAKFSLALEGLAMTLKGALLATASALENLFYIAQRASTTVDNLKELQYGMRAIGLSAEDANSALEGLAMAMRLNPGNESLLRYLGVATRDASGAMRDTTQITGDFVARLSKMPFFIAAQYASMFGINARTLYQLLQNFGQLQAKEKEWRDAAKQVGVDLQDSAVKSKDFMNEMRAVIEVLDLLWIKISTVLIERLKPQLESFRQFLLAHAKDITTFGISIGNSILDASDALLKILPQFDKLVQSTIGWKNALDAAADIIVYRILGPVGLLAKLAIDLYNWYGKAEKEHPFPNQGQGPWTPEQKQKLQKENEGLQEGIKKFLYEIFPSLKNGPLFPGLKNDPLFKDPVQKQSAPGIDQPNNIIPASLVRSVATPKFLEFRQTLLTYVNAAIVELLIEVFSSYGNAQRTGTGNFDPNSVVRVTSRMPVDSADSHAGSSPLGVRQNNPGNIRQWAGAGSANGFAVFPSVMAGMVAMRDNLLAYARRGLDTVSSIISRWAPSSENNTGAYITSLSKMLGVNPNAHLNMRDPNTLAKLMQGITRIEQGYNPYSADTYERAVRMGTSGMPAAGARNEIHLNQKTEVHVHGAEPHSTAREVERKQEQVNASLVRGFRTAVLA